MTRRALAVAAVTAIAVLSATACGDSDDDSIGVHLTDYEVKPDASSAPAGETTFDITNDADQVHELVVIKSDLAAEDLPLDEDGLVDERGAGLEFIDEVEDLDGGEDASLTVDLTAGDHVLLCNLPGHFDAGMHTSFSVG